MSILDSLSKTESGGNFSAQNNAVGSSGRSGHFGRLQFGRDRLDDAVRAGVLPQGITPQQFIASPEMQRATEAWHERDMLRQAENMGLTKYIGTKINGTTVTMDAILAMGHLGGMGGARKYLASGGRYNPSDKFGTSLSSYAKRHGGASSVVASPAKAKRTLSTPQTENRFNQVQRPKLPQINALSAAPFQSQQNAFQGYGFGAGNNPFVR